MAHIERKPNGSVKIVVSSGYDTTGKQIRHSHTIEVAELANLTDRQKEKEIERQKVLFEQDVKNDRLLTETQKSFKDFLKISGYNATFLSAQQLQELMTNTQRYVESRLKEGD